jgi:hypothetical protein
MFFGQSCTSKSTRCGKKVEHVSSHFDTRERLQPVCASIGTVAALDMSGSQLVSDQSRCPDDLTGTAATEVVHSQLHGESVEHGSAKPSVETGDTLLLQDAQKDLTCAGTFRADQFRNGNLTRCTRSIQSSSCSSSGSDGGRR